MPKVLTILASASALALTACSTTLGPNFEQPASPTVGGYAMAGDAAAAGVRLSPDVRTAGPWWTVLGSPALDRTIREALASSPTIAEANATLQRVQAEADAARGGSKPQVDAQAGVQRERINTQTFGFTGFPSPTITLYQVGGAVNYDLDLFGRQRRTVEAAESLAERQARNADAAYLTLTGQVALQAIRIAALREQIAAGEAIVADDRRLIDIATAGYRVGGQPPTGIVAGQAQLSLDQAEIEPLQRQLTDARHQLALLVGNSPGEWTAPDFDIKDFTLPAEAPVALPSTLVRQRPDILAAEADLHAATARVGVATAAQYPDIRLTAALTQGALKPLDLFSYDSSGWNIGGQIVGPIFRGGTLKAQQRAAEAEARASLARYQATVLRAFVQVADLLGDLANDQQAIATRAKVRTAAELGVQSAQRAYSLGAEPLLSVVDAQRTLNRTRRMVVDAQAQRYQDLVQLLSATAADWRPETAS